MALSLSDLKSVRADKPPRILIYGPPGIGKTTLASEFPAPVFLQIEDGTPGDVELTSFGKLDSFADVMDALRALYRDRHGYKTVVVDSVSELQKLIFEETCKQGDEKGERQSIEDFGYGKGYVYASYIWQRFIRACNVLRNDKGMTIILIAHSAVQRFDDPETVSYDRYQIDLHKGSVGVIEREMDAILLLKQPVNIQTEDKGFKKERTIAKGNSVVLMYTQGRPAFTAKNRYNMPADIRYEKGKGYEALAKFLPAAPAQAVASKKES